MRTVKPRNIFDKDASLATNGDITPINSNMIKTYILLSLKSRTSNKIELNLINLIETKI